MTINMPIANPIRFRLIQENSISVSIDYVNRLPQFDIMEIGEKYQQGVFPVKNVPRWKIDEEIAFQANGPFTSAVMIIIGPSISTSMSYTNITPAGYVAGTVRKWSYTPTVSGFYYVRFVFADATGNHEANSDYFYVTDDLPNEKDLLELSFYSDENINGFVFDDWYKAYYQGTIKKIQGQTTKSIFDEDTYQVVGTKRHPKINVTINDIHTSYFDVVATQLLNENIKINSIPYACPEEPEQEPIDKSDLVNITFDLIGQYDNNYMKNS